MNTLDQIVLPDGTVKRLGNNPTPAGLLRAFPVYGTVPNTPLVPESEWKDRIDQMGNDWSDPYLGPIHDQNGYGMCNASATASAMEYQRAVQGLPYVPLSGGDLYMRIAWNGGDNGSTLEDGIKAAMDDGIASVPVVPYLDWRGENPGAREDRKKYRVLEAFLCPTASHVMSAVLNKFSIVSGIWWYDSYSRLDQDGWLPRPAGNRGGHAVHGYKPAYRTVNGQVQYGIRHKNSWTVQWGLRGLCVFPMSVYQSLDIGGWWAVRSVVDEGNVLPVTR